MWLRRSLKSETNYRANCTERLTLGSYYIQKDYASTAQTFAVTSQKGKAENSALIYTTNPIALTYLSKTKVSFVTE